MKASKKLITASVALVASLAVSVGSTFAWFTTSNYVAVGGINANVTTADSDVEVRQVASNGDVIKDWAYSVQLDLSVESENLLLTALGDPSTNGVNLYDRENYAKEVNETSTGTKTTANGTSTENLQDAVAKEGFLEVYLQFRTKTEGVNGIYLSKASTVTGTEGKRENVQAWAGIENKYGTDVTVGEEIHAEAKDAVRIGFYTVGEYTKGADREASRELTASLTAIGVWAPNEFLLNGAVYDGETDYSTSNLYRGLMNGYYQNNLAKDYEAYLVSNSLHGDASLDSDGVDDLYDFTGYTKYIKEGEYEGAYTYIDGSTDTAAKFLQLNLEEKTATSATEGTPDTGIKGAYNGDEYKYAKLCFRLWTEGTDGDCFNNIFADEIIANLLFEVDKT